jgi:predicted nucleic acid-binding protein
MMPMRLEAATLAMENGAVLASTDQDFRRFRQLRWTNPLAA